MMSEEFEQRNSILMIQHYTDLGSISDLRL